jgi:hypothetical protein
LSRGRARGNVYGRWVGHPRLEWYDNLVDLCPKFFFFVFGTMLVKVFRFRESSENQHPVRGGGGTIDTAIVWVAMEIRRP